MTDIYYFSGTGNTLFLAKQIASHFNVKPIAIASLIEQNTIETDADCIGICLPVYYEEPPVIIKEFIRKLKDLKDKYIFLITCFGGASGYTIPILKKELKKRDAKAHLAFGVHMTQNAFLKKSENHAELNAAAIARCKLIADKVKAKETGTYHHSLFAEGLIKVLQPIMIRPLFRKGLKKMSGLSKASTDEQIRNCDKVFKTDERCDGCGICAKVCPVNNIKIEDNHPVWQHRCENCLACYHWCPKQTIQTKLAQKGYFYRNPGIKIKEMMLQ